MYGTVDALSCARARPDDGASALSPAVSRAPTRRARPAAVAILVGLALCATRADLRRASAPGWLRLSAATLAPSAPPTSAAPSAPPSSAQSAPPTSLAPTPRPTAPAPTPATAPYTLVTIPMSTFLASAKVEAFLASVGVDRESPRHVLERFVPRKLVLQVWPSRVQGELGPDALGGYVAVNICYLNSTEYTASYLIVTDLYGADVSIYPTLRGSAATSADDGESPRPLHLHFCALKLRDPATFLLAGDNGTTEAGGVYLWKWATDEYVHLLDNKNCHDAQWAYDAPGDDGAVWMPDFEGYNLQKYNVSSGATLATVPINYTSDINHAQLVDGDKTAVVSSRETNSVIKVDIATGEAQWTLGGDLGEFDIVTPQGDTTPAGESYFSGQHNAEYYGEVVDEWGDTVEEYGMFDNAYEQRKSSRVLVLRVNANAKVARVVYEKDVGAYCPEYGDADRMPTGNILSTFWVQGYNTSQWGSRDGREEFDMRIEETVTSTLLPAWRLDVQGPECDGAVCHYKARPMFTWRAYSVERFYTAPLVWNVSCEAAGATLALATTNNFRQNNPDAATYTVSDSAGTSVATGSFSFMPHWQATPLTISLADCSACEHGTVEVANRWGDTTSASFSCAKDPARRR